MFESMTFDAILQAMLDRVPDDVDKREGSIIWDALAPTAMELAEMYANLDILLRRTFADSADGDDLERRVGEHGVDRKKASRAIRRAVFTNTDGLPFNVSIGSRYRLGDVVYEALEKTAEGTFTVRADTYGVIGNQDYGALLPTEPVDGLGSAVLTDVLIPGEDEQTDESLYAKYLIHINDVAFGGNRADYRLKILNIQGVGGVQLFRAPEGGGTTKAVIIDSTYNVPTPELVALVQETMDPLEHQGDGYGLAPIGHKLSVVAVEQVIMNFAATLSLAGVTLGQVEPLVEAAVESYLAEVRKEWVKGNEASGIPLVVRITHLESRILSIEGVQDITGTTLNGAPMNLTLRHEIPVKGSVNISE